MIGRSWKIYGTPRWWISAGLGTFLFSVLVGYHQDQIAADSAIADKAPLPLLVQVQDFDRSAHSNMLGETQLLGEVSAREAIIVDIGSSDTPRPVQVVPIYPVTDRSAPMAIWYLHSIYDAVRRPVPRSSAPDIAEARQAFRETETTALGLLITEGRVADDINVIGPGVNGPLVSLLGTEAEGGDRTLAMAAFADRGVSLSESVPVVELYPAGQRPTMPVQDFSAPRRVLEICALALVAIGILKLLPPVTIGRARVDTSEEVEAIGDFPGVFQPIVPQEELTRTDEDAS